MYPIFGLANCVFQHGMNILPTRCSSTSVKFLPFARVKRLKPSEENNLELAFELDSNPEKINLAGEAYRNIEGKPHVFQVVRKAEIGVACDDKYIHEQKPILGNPQFIRAANELVLNRAAPALIQNRVLGVQTRSSLDALFLAAQFLHQKMNCNVCMLANPSCEVCERIFKCAGFTCHTYQYYSEKNGELNIYGLVADLMTAPEGAVVLLDACAHNPTALDPSIDEWKLIAHIIKCKKLLPVFHLESHGLASGDLATDTWAVRYFVDSGFDMFCAQSFVKNFGLFDETVGQLMVVLSNSIQMQTVREQFEAMLLMNNEKSSSVFASRIVAKILSNVSLRHEWTIALQDIHHRMQQMRAALSNKLDVLKTPGSWDHLRDQTGPHLYINLTAEQLQELRKNHVYVPNSGRINLCALSQSNLDFVASAINNVMQLAKCEADSNASITPCQLAAQNCYKDFKTEIANN